MAPFPPIERWRLPQAACELTREAVMPAGRHGCESGVFWLGTRDSLSDIAVVVFPTGDGVKETPFYWSVSPEVYAAVSAWAKPRGFALVAVAHTHLESGRPRMSRTDRRQGLKVPDALAIILPRAGRESEPSAWGWFVYEGGDYRELAPDERTRRVEMTSGGAQFVVIGSDAEESA